MNEIDGKAALDHGMTDRFSGCLARAAARAQPSAASAVRAPFERRRDRKDTRPRPSAARSVWACLYLQGPLEKGISPLGVNPSDLTRKRAPAARLTLRSNHFLSEALVSGLEAMPIS